jgi:hypothetical protein
MFTTGGVVERTTGDAAVAGAEGAVTTGDVLVAGADEPWATGDVDVVGAFGNMSGGGLGKTGTSWFKMFLVLFA